jgi:SAM-dependent methyltransferase
MPRFGPPRIGRRLWSEGPKRRLKEGEGAHMPSREQIAAAAAYEKLHVPALFRQWVPHVLNAAGVVAGDHLLDLACGTGVLARGAVERVRPGGFVAGVDPDPGMLAVAAALGPQAEWRMGRAENLPFRDEDFDVVVSQFGMMFFENPEAAVFEMMRVLRSRGRVAVAVWDTVEGSGAYPILVDLLQRRAGQAAADALRAPFGLGDPDRLAGHFQDGGAGSVEVDTLPGTARFPSVRAMVEADLRGWLPVMGVTLEEEQIETILAEAEEALDGFVTENGEVSFEVRALIVRGSRLN